jgi:hypothetical protein
MAISRLQIAESEKDFVHGFFENVLHGPRTAGRGEVCAGLTLKTPGLVRGKSQFDGRRRLVTRLTNSRANVELSRRPAMVDVR